jgi:hypothetical protein
MTIEAVRAVFPDAEAWEVGDREAVHVDGWLAVHMVRGWIAAREKDGTWYAPLPREARSGGAHTSFARKIEGLQTTAHKSALLALESVLGEG